MKTGKYFIQLVLGGMPLLLLLLGLAPEQVEAAPTMTKVSAGNGYTCALTSAERVWCWGWNGYGQLGNGQSGNLSATPVQVKNLDGVKAISASGSHTCAMMSGGTVRCWGDNHYGQLGNGQSGSGKFSATPVRVLNLEGVTAISGGYRHTCALTNPGAVECWGDNQYGQLGNGQSGSSKFSATPVRAHGLGGVRAISAGFNHTCALTSAGTVKCWGFNDSGQLGNGQSGSGKLSAIPVHVKNQAGTGLLGGIKDISAGGQHGCALTTANTVWCWGHNDSGQLGNILGIEGSIATPVQVMSETGTGSLGGVAAIRAGGWHTCALKAGVVWCWGFNDDGRLGNGESGDDVSSIRPQRVLNLSGIMAFSAGGNHTCAVTSAGAVWCWGNNYTGQLGNGQSGLYKFSAVPVAIVWPTASQ